ncbi:MAG: hypothetical protein FWC87_02310 [Acidimicrobiaceae bacterium]|nr:hypothetical protein [Acidimicrobiaceae bacterium]
MTGATRRYLFGPLERRGLLLGLFPSQLLSLAGGLLLALVVVHASPDAFGILAALAIMVGGAAGACLPLAGRPPAAWLPVAISWLARRAKGPALSTVPLLGQAQPFGQAQRRSHVSGRRLDRTGERTTQSPPSKVTSGPGALAGGVEILAVPALPGQGALGVLRDRRAGTWAAVLPVRSGAFALLDPVDKERRLAAWGSVLAALGRAGSPVHRMQWVERTFAGDAEALAGHAADTSPAPLGGSSTTSPNSNGAAREAYAELIATAGPATIEHECLIVLAVNGRRRPRSFDRGEAGVVDLLRRELRLLQGQLRGVELAAGDPLDASGLTRVLRAGFEPGVRRRRSRMQPAAAWPMATDEAWSSVRVEGAWYATFWIAEWPRVEVGPDFLAPLLLGGAERTVSLTMAPVGPERARRQVEAARTAEAADEELRRRAGFLPTARRRREAEGVAQREAELADGHAEFRFSGYVTVSGRDRVALEAACAEIEQQGQQARLDLRRLFGQQGAAFTWTLPLARGLAAGGLGGPA